MLVSLYINALVRPKRLLYIKKIVWVTLVTTVWPLICVWPEGLLVGFGHKMPLIARGQWGEPQGLPHALHVHLLSPLLTLPHPWYGTSPGQWKSMMTGCKLRIQISHFPKLAHWVATLESDPWLWVLLLNWISSTSVRCETPRPISITWHCL